MKDRLKILFLCTGNSCQSQMAEGWVNHLKRDVIEVSSAGIETHGLNPPALAKDEPTEETAMAHYHRVRDEIRAFVESLPEKLKNPS